MHDAYEDDEDEEEAVADLVEEGDDSESESSKLPFIQS